MSCCAFGFADLVVLAGVPHPIPFRTRSLSPPAPMVLCLKARESRSLPGLLSQMPSRSNERGLSHDFASFPEANARLGRLCGPRPLGRIGPRSRFWTRPSGYRSRGGKGSAGRIGRQRKFGDAGWSSPVARQAHNLKVPGSNPGPAPKTKNSPASNRGAVFVSGAPLRPRSDRHSPWS